MNSLYLQLDSGEPCTWHVDRRTHPSVMKLSVTKLPETSGVSLMYVIVGTENRCENQFMVISAAVYQPSFSTVSTNLHHH